MEATRQLWLAAGLDAIETKEIQVQRTFASFEQFWTISMAGSVGPKIAQMAASDIDLLKQTVRARLAEDALGHITGSAKAIAVRGRVPK